VLVQSFEPVIEGERSHAPWQPTRAIEPVDGLVQRDYLPGVGQPVAVSGERLGVHSQW
jgi:hypothetical protein